MSAQPPTSWIHYDPERVDYSFSASEMEQLRGCANNQWKDLTIACAGVGIPCLINAVSIARAQTTSVPTLAFVLNLVVGVVCVVAGAGFGLAWRRTATSIDKLMSQIRAKPKVPFVASVTNVGTLPEQETPGA